MASVRWFAVLTQARAEPLAAKHLKRQGYGVLYLHYPATVTHARRVRRVIRPYFPRYVFASCAGAMVPGPIARTIGVAALVQAGPEPLEIPGSVIDELAARGDADGLVNELGGGLQQRERFRAGQEALIARGPLQGLLATILSDDGSAKVACVLRWLGRRVNVTFEFDALAVSSPALRSAPD